MLNYFYFTPAISVITDLCVSLCMCLYVCSHMSKATCPSLTYFLYVLPVALAESYDDSDYMTGISHLHCLTVSTMEGILCIYRDSSGVLLFSQPGC